MAKINHDIRLLVTDMDGTFLNSSSEIPQKNIDVVKRLKQHGINTVICTGRPVSFVREYVHQSGVSTTVISCNGAVIADAFSGEVIYAQRLELPTIESVVNFCNTNDLDCLAYTAAGDVLFRKNSRRIEVFKEYNKKIDSSVKPVEILPMEKHTDILFGGSICKLLITLKNETEVPLVNKFLSGRDEIYFVSSANYLIDIMSKNISKGTGVKMLAEKLQIPVSQICVAGDNKNDIPMFKTAGASICMANGDDEAKSFATFITKTTNDENGFCEAAELILGFQYQF